MSSHLYNKGELPREDTYAGYDRAALERQIPSSRRDLQSVIQQLADTKARGPQYDGHESMVPGASESRRNEWRQKVEYLESKIRFIEHEITLAERALNRLR